MAGPFVEKLRGAIHAAAGAAQYALGTESQASNAASPTAFQARR